MRRLVAIAVFLLGSIGPQPQAILLARSEPATTLADNSCLAPREDMQRANTRVRIMDSRYTDLSAAMKGYKASGVPLVGLRSGCFVTLAAGDDEGVFYYIPKLALASGLSLQHAIELFLGIPIVAATIVGGLGLWKLVTNGWLRSWALLGLALIMLLVWRCGDTYGTQYVVAVSVIPWVLHFRGRKAVLLTLCAASALLCGLVNTVRTGSGIPVLVFLVATMMLLSSSTARTRIAASVVLVSLFAAPSLWMRHVLSARDNFLQSQASFHGALIHHRAYWHSIYIGFGFLSNREVPAYEDSIAEQKVKSIDPTAPYQSPEYEAIMRRVVLRLIREHFDFVLASEFVKFSVVITTLIIFTNIGLVAALFSPKGLPVEAPFWLAMAMAAIPSMLVLPRPHYLLGLMALSFIYGIVSIDHWLITNSRKQEPASPFTDESVKSESPIFCA